MYVLGVGVAGSMVPEEQGRRGERPQNSGMTMNNPVGKKPSIASMVRF